MASPKRQKNKALITPLHPPSDNFVSEKIVKLKLKYVKFERRKKTHSAHAPQIKKGKALHTSERNIKHKPYDD
jgi:hypothetical protein